MTIWSGEIKELDNLYSALKGNLPDIMREMEQLIKTDDPNVVMLYSRRCLEIIVTDLCECELKRPRKTEPLKGIIDKLNSEEKVPSYIITSMLSLNSMANYGAHPKDFDPEQVRPVLNNLSIIIKWYLKYKDFKVVSTTDKTEKKQEYIQKETPVIVPVKSGSKKWLITAVIIIIIALTGYFLLSFYVNRNKSNAYIQQEVNNGNYLIDTRDNQPYRIVRIGDQLWMAENLKATKLNDGTPIPLVKDEKEWQNLQTPAFCWYSNDKKAYKNTYGALYNWYTVNTGKLCPTGWHVPASNEWTTLTKFTGDSIDWIARGDTVPVLEFAGRKLKESGTIHWNYNDSISSTDEYGFTALPAGERTVYGVFWGIGHEGSWWSSTEVEYDKRDAKNREMYSDQNHVTDIEQYKQFGLSVRCIKDSVK